MATRATKKNVPSNYAKLKRFGQRHYNYVNQMLGDKTTREVIGEQFANASGWKLETEEDEHYGAHHFCTRRRSSRRRTAKWCSVDEGIQCIDTHPADVLCQSYSVLFYMGKLGRASKLTKALQLRMIAAWREILKNTAVTEQIISASKQGVKERRPVWGDRAGSNVALKRGKRSVAEIKKVLKEWEEYGWQYFMLRKHEIPDADLRYLLGQDEEEE